MGRKLARCNADPKHGRQTEKYGNLSNQLSRCVLTVQVRVATLVAVQLGEP